MVFRYSCASLNMASHFLVGGLKFLGGGKFGLVATGGRRARLLILVFLAARWALRAFFLRFAARARAEVLAEGTTASGMTRRRYRSARSSSLNRRSSTLWWKGNRTERL